MMLLLIWSIALQGRTARRVYVSYIRYAKKYPGVLANIRGCFHLMHMHKHRRASLRNRISALKSSEQVTVRCVYALSVRDCDFTILDSFQLLLATTMRTRRSARARTFGAAASRGKIVEKKPYLLQIFVGLRVKMRHHDCFRMPHS